MRLLLIVSWCGSFDVLIIGAVGACALCHVIVYPLSQGTVTCYQQRQDVTLASLVCILNRGTFEPTDLECASQWIDSESPD